MAGRVPLVLATALLSCVLAGCAADSPAGAPGTPSASPEVAVGDGAPDVKGTAAVREAALRCGGGTNAIPALETSFLGSCWGHVGHHTYLLPEPAVLLGLKGTVFAVEVAQTDVAGAPELAVEASLDGVAWSRVGAIPYPLGDDPGDRYRINVSIDTAPTPLRMLRVRMPLSQYEGLAGYLDNSNLTARLAPSSPPAATFPERTRASCGEGFVESFFPGHPCWFGGYDNVDRAQGGDPAYLHASWDFTDPGWFDSPSFLHTYVLGESAGGPLTATVEAQLWRLAHLGLCSGSDPANAPLPPEVVAQASVDGVSWTEVARAAAPDWEPVPLSGTVPDGSRLLRFGASAGAAYDQGGCHHPVAFVVHSEYALG